MTHDVTPVSMPVVPGVDHRWIDVDGVRLHVAEAGVEHRGGGPSLVLVHGWPQHWYCWRHVMPALAATHHVVAIDLRGAGWSDAPDGAAAYDKRVLADDVAGAIGVLGLDRPVLVGHDWGAWTSLLVASRHSGLVRGVVAAAIIAPWTPVPWNEVWRFAYQPLAGGPWGPFLHRGLGQFFLKSIYRMGGAPRFRWSRAVREEYLSRFREPARARAGALMYRRFLTTEFRESQAGRYARPVDDAPLLLLPGSSDMVLAPKLVRRAEGPANVTVREIAGAGHWVPEEQPDALVDHVRRFVEQVS